MHLLTGLQQAAVRDLGLAAIEPLDVLLLIHGVALQKSVQGFELKP